MDWSDYEVDGQLSIFDLQNENKLYVIQISYEETKPFILNIHYARRMPCVQYAFGLYKDCELIGVITYGQPASPSYARDWQGKKIAKT